MSNLSLMNPGTSLNFDGAALQNQEEAEYRKEEEQQQHELRQLLTNAFDDLLDDDILSVTSDDSVNVSGCQDLSESGRTPRRKRASGRIPTAKASSQEWGYPVPLANGRAETVSHDVGYSQPHGEAPNFGGTYNLSSQGPVQEYRTNDYNTNTEGVTDYKGQGYLQWGGSVENLDPSRGHIEVTEHAQMHEHMPGFHYHQPCFDNEAERMDSMENRIIVGVERGETEGGNEHLRAEAQKQLWSQNYNQHFRDLYREDDIPGGDNSHEQFRTGASTFANTHRHLDSEIQINFANGQTLPDKAYGFGPQSGQFSLKTESQPMELNYNQTYHSSLPTNINEGMVRHMTHRQDLGAPLQGPPSPRKQDYPESYKVQYKAPQSEQPISSTNQMLPEPESTNQEGAGNQIDFLQQDGGEDERQAGQLQILYKARGRQLEDLRRDLDTLKQESGRENRILKHQLSLAQGEKEGVASSYRQCQELLQETKDDNAQLLGKLQAVEAQVESLNTIRDEYVKKLQTSETTIENLTHELSNLQQSDSLARARNQHEAVVSSMQQKFDKEVLDLKEKLDIANETINQKNTDISCLRQQVNQLTQVSEKSQISRAETINRLTQSLEESQKRCQSLLETASSQEVSELKISLKQMTASKKMSSEMCDTLQSEVKELKEQLSMFESASTLGIYSSTQTRSGLGDDSMTDLGIRKTLDFSTPRSQAKFDGSQSSSELITSLKVELERCLTSNRQKRSQVSKMQEELREYKKEVKALREDNSQLEKLTGEQKMKLQDFEELLQPGQKMSAVEARLRKDIENLAREKTAILEDNEELKKRLEEVGANDERLTEINQELTNQISRMVRDYDHDKRDALERCQRTCEQVHEDARDMLRQELETKFSIERAQIVTKYETEIAKIRSDLIATQQELDKVKDLYVRTSEERTELEDVLTRQFQDKREEEMKILRDELEREKQDEMERQTEQLDINRGELRAKIMDEVKVTQEEEIKQRLEAELAKARVDWLGEQDTEHVRQEVRQAVEKEMALKHEAAMEDMLQEKIHQAKVTWMAERKILFESEIQQRMQTEKVTWQQLANERLEEAVNTAIDHAKAQWLKTEDGSSQYEDLLESAKSKWKSESEQKLEETVTAAVEKAKEDWEQRAAEQHKDMVEILVKERLTTEKTIWQVEADALHEVDIKHAVESAQQKWMTERSGRESMDPAFQNRLQAEKQKWQLEADRKLQLEVNRVMERAQKQGLSEVEKKNLVEEEVTKRLEVERERWRKEMEARVLAEVETTVKATETEWRLQEEEEKKKMKEVLEDEIGGRLRQEMNRAVEDARQEWEKKHLSQHATLAAGQSAAEVTRSILEQEVETLKLEKTRLVTELKEKESAWFQERQTLNSQKDAERRQAMKEVADQCERDYKAFMEEHQNTLTEALRNSRQQQDLMEQEKRELQQRYEELTDLKSRELQTGQSDLSTSITVDGDLETSILEQEREVWQKQTDKLKKSIQSRDSLLKQADAHMSQEVQRMHGELEAAYQQQLEMEVHKLQERYQSEFNDSLPTSEHEMGKIQVQIQKMAENFEKERASYIRKIEHLEDQLAEKSQQLIDLEQEQEQEMKDEYQKELDRLLQEKHSLIEKIALKQSELDERVKENDKLHASVKNMESAYKNDMKSQKEKFEDINNRLQKSEKSLQEVRKKNSLEKEELKNALSESEAAMGNLTQKMMERQKTNTMAVEAMKKQHKLEKKELLKQLKKRSDRTMTSTPVQTEESGDMMLDLRSQYLDTVDKIREDVMQHITQTNLRAADTVRTGITREKQVTVTQLKRFYRVSIRKILQNELIGADLEGKLASIDQALETLSISLSSSRSNTPDQEVKATDLSQAKSSTSSVSLDVSSASNLTPRSESSITSTGSSCQNYQVTLSRAENSTGNAGTGSDAKQNSRMVPKNGKDVFPRPSQNLSLFDRNGSRILQTPSPVESEPETRESLSVSFRKDDARSFRPVDPPERRTSSRSKSGHGSLHPGKRSEAKPRELNSYGQMYDNDGFRRPREPAQKRNSTDEHRAHRGQSTGVGPHRAHSTDIGSHRAHSTDVGPHRAHSIDVGSHRAHSSDIGSHRAHSTDVGPHRAHSIDVGSHRGHSTDFGSHQEPQQVRDSSLPPAVSKRRPQLSLLRRSMEDEFSTPKPLEPFSYKGMSKAQSEMALNVLADFENNQEGRRQVMEDAGRSPGSVRIQYKYTPLRQSLKVGSPSTSLISNHSLSEGDLRIAEADEPVLNFQSMGLGKPSPRKFNPVPERLESESGYHTPKKSPKNLFGNKMARSLENLSVLGLTLEEQTLEEEFTPLASLKSDNDSSSFRAFERVGEFPAQLDKGRQLRDGQSDKGRQVRETQSYQTKGMTHGGDPQVTSNQSASRITSRTNGAHSYRDFHKERQLQMSRDDSGRESFQTPPVNVSVRVSKR
ncbi:centrosomal protein of 152 kDa-like [Haliotis cracherodii]|uniref:centrosomal protein of 152 kDa-like n=1 Tax=Haliotis cracherodii TaxID=6455 RepID=UPI0039EAE6A2